MCEKCAELAKTIEHYRMIMVRVPDPQTVEGINKLIEKMQAEKARAAPRETVLAGTLGCPASAIPPRIFRSMPRRVLPLFIEIGVGALWQIAAPCRFERAARRFK